MNRYRAGGAGIASGGIVLFVALLGRGSIRHPVAAAESTGPPEFVAIATAFALVTFGCLLVLRSYMPVQRRHE